MNENFRHNNHNKITTVEQNRVQIELSDLLETSIADFPLHLAVFLDISLNVKVEKKDEEHCPVE